ncbi:glutaredoxin family protein [Candidatus Poribacteria bacterium]|nr:glutaredoxin family protein [Candidatus Poribacteria bacterium]
MAHEVIIYTKKGDISCQLLKKRFDREGIRYKEIEVSQNQKAKAEMLKLSDGQDIVPVVIMDGKVTVGLDSGR